MATARFVLNRFGSAAGVASANASKLDAPASARLTSFCWNAPTNMMLTLPPGIHPDNTIAIPLSGRWISIQISRAAGQFESADRLRAPMNRRKKKGCTASQELRRQLGQPSAGVGAGRCLPGRQSSLTNADDRHNLGTLILAPSGPLQ